MTRNVDCVRYGAGQEGLERAPYPGELGQHILARVSRRAWNDWLAQQTMLINENRLSPVDPKARAFLQQQAEAYFFGDGSERPPGYSPPQA